jgi:hypothetical protein
MNAITDTTAQPVAAKLATRWPAAFHRLACDAFRHAKLDSVP